MKRLAIIFSAAAALALTPAAAASPNPAKADRPDKPAKAERTKKAKPDSARARCLAEKQDLGAAAFAAKYGKARTKGSARAKAKAARAAMGRCVSKTTKVIRAEREAEEDAESELDEEASDCWCEVFVDDAPDDAEKPEPDDGDVVVDKEDDPKPKGHEDDDPVAGLGDAVDLD